MFLASLRSIAATARSRGSEIGDSATDVYIPSLTYYHIYLAKQLSGRVVEASFPSSPPNRSRALSAADIETPSSLQAAA
jgi:hypothetical protein